MMFDVKDMPENLPVGEYVLRYTGINTQDSDHPDDWIAEFEYIGPVGEPETAETLTED